MEGKEEGEEKEERGKGREKGREGEGREGGRLRHGFWGDVRPCLILCSTCNWLLMHLSVGLKNGNYLSLLINFAFYMSVKLCLKPVSTSVEVAYPFS